MMKSMEKALLRRGFIPLGWMMSASGTMRRGHYQGPLIGSIVIYSDRGWEHWEDHVGGTLLDSGSGRADLELYLISDGQYQYFQ